MGANLLVVDMDNRNNFVVVGRIVDDVLVDIGNFDEHNEC